MKERSLVEKELRKFWDLLDATRYEIITAGKRPFDPNLLLKALQRYDERFEEDFGKHWTDPRAVLFWQKVIGYGIYFGVEAAFKV